MIKAEDIDKYNSIVQEKFPPSSMRRQGDFQVIWIHGGIRVANLVEEPGGLKFSMMKQKDPFDRSPFSSL